MTTPPRPGQRARLEALLLRHWYRPRATWLARCLGPLSWLYAGVAWASRRRQPERAPVPVIVVGNLVAGGAGKTPTVIALAAAMQHLGFRPGVISRGHGRQGDGVQPVDVAATSLLSGDEPWLIARRTGLPVWVGRQRIEVARALCAAHPEVDLLIADDGLQHTRLGRDAEVIVFDERGAGNGLLLPAGPLRQRLPASLSPRQRVLYNAASPTTWLPGACATRQLAGACTLEDWHAGRPATREALSALSSASHSPRAPEDVPLAAAGIASPERFFTMLEAAGLHIARLPLPDHHDFAELPWANDTAVVLVTEKDAAKLDPARAGRTRIWVVPLDFALPEALVLDLCGLLGPPRAP